MNYCFLLIALICIIETYALRKQGVAVKGRLMCGPRPANNTKVRIVDIDYGKYICLLNLA